MINANMETMIRIITKQFSQLAQSYREPDTFLSQLEVKGHASSSSGNPNEPMRKVNAVISLHSDQEVDNQVRKPNETCSYPHQFFQNSSPYSNPETGPSSESRDTTGGVPNASDRVPSPKSTPKEEELQEKDSSS